MMFEGLKNFLEKNLFGVCSYLGEKLGIASSHIRMFFIYATFLTLGSPVFVYMCIAFVLKLKNFIFSKRAPHWYF